MYPATDIYVASVDSPVTEERVRDARGEVKADKLDEGGGMLLMHTDSGRFRYQFVAIAVLLLLLVSMIGEANLNPREAQAKNENECSSEHVGANAVFLTACLGSWELAKTICPAFCPSLQGDPLACGICWGSVTVAAISCGLSAWGLWQLAERCF